MGFALGAYKLELEFSLHQGNTAVRTQRVPVGPFFAPERLEKNRAKAIYSRNSKALKEL